MVCMKWHKISLLYIPTQILIRSKVLYVCVFDTLEHFCQTNKYNEISYLLLIVLDKVGKEKNDFRDLNFQLKHHISDLKFLCLP